MKKLEKLEVIYNTKNHFESIEFEKKIKIFFKKEDWTWIERSKNFETDIRCIKFVKECNNMKYKSIKYQAIIDRIENEQVILEMPDMSMLVIEEKHLPIEIKEGNFLDIEISINVEKEKELKKEISKLQKELLERRKQ